MTFDYFAYGSNMLIERLRNRCLNPKEIGRADNRIIEFSKLSKKDGSGKATLRCQAGHRTPGVLFRIPIAERNKLDRYEGAGKGGGYIRCDKFPVHRTDNNQIAYVVTYLATFPKPNLKPYDWYLALVIAGALKHGLDGSYQEMLRRVPYCPDTDCDRRERRDAMEVLDDAGFSDYQCLLGPA